VAALRYPLPRMNPLQLSAAEARRFLVSHLGLARPSGKGATAVRRVLAQLRSVQLDPLDAIGTNVDLVMLARVDGIARGEVWRHVYPGHGFEHFARERCLLPAAAFPWYRGRAMQAPWWRHDERESRVARDRVDAVLAEIRARGPVAARDLTDHGSIEPLDWGGWKGTAKTTSMAIEILWTRCEIVVSGRTENGAKLYDVPERALPAVADHHPDGELERWALADRVEAAGLLTRAGGASWSTLSEVRTSPLPEAMIAGGELLDVHVEGSSRRYLAPRRLLDGPKPRYDDRIRILGPLDPLLWDRNLVRTAFGFDYIWEVYKPAHLRKWGWYVCPLLDRDQLVGRIEARIAGHQLRVSKIWREADAELDLDKLRTALERHAEACGCRIVRMPARVRV
jgi:uncharacterized protein YcaQ